MFSPRMAKSSWLNRTSSTKRVNCSIAIRATIARAGLIARGKKGRRASATVDRRPRGAWLRVAINAWCEAGMRRERERKATGVRRSAARTGEIVVEQAFSRRRTT